MENQPTNINFPYFLNKEVKIILTFSNGKAITYRGNIINLEPDSILFFDKMHGHLLISKKDVSQILEVQG